MTPPPDTKHSINVRNRIAAARAWGDVAARDALHYGAPSAEVVRNVIGYWREVLEACERGEDAEGKETN
jgi:hypothetical protein